MSFWIKEIDGNPVPALVDPFWVWVRDEACHPDCFCCEVPFVATDQAVGAIEDAYDGSRDPKCDHGDLVWFLYCRPCAEKLRIRARDVPRELWLREVANTYGWLISQRVLGANGAA